MHVTTLPAIASCRMLFTTAALSLCANYMRMRAVVQVTTQRVKTAQKAEIPHIDEPVSKIENVGVQTQSKLQDIKGAAGQIGMHCLDVVHNCVTTGKWSIWSLDIPV